MSTSIIDPQVVDDFTLNKKDNENNDTTVRRINYDDKEVTVFVVASKYDITMKRIADGSFVYIVHGDSALTFNIAATQFSYTVNTPSTLNKIIQYKIYTYDKNGVLVNSQTFDESSYKTYQDSIASQALQATNKYKQEQQIQANSALMSTLIGMGDGSTPNTIPQTSWSITSFIKDTYTHPPPEMYILIILIVLLIGNYLTGLALTQKKPITYSHKKRRSIDDLRFARKTSALTQKLIRRYAPDEFLAAPLS